MAGSASCDYCCYFTYDDETEEWTAILKYYDGASWLDVPNNTRVYYYKHSD